MMDKMKATDDFEWKGENQLVSELSDEEFKKIGDDQTKDRDTKTQGRDGLVTVWEKKFTHRGLKFVVKVNRYFVMNVPLFEMKGMNKLGKWAVLEYDEKDEKTKKIVELVSDMEKELSRYDFLYADTLHHWNEGQSLKQMVEVMYKQGIENIDWWLDESQKSLNEYIKEVKEKWKRL